MPKNRWILPRNKRILTPIPKIIAVLSGVSLNQQWVGQRGLQLSLEEALEKSELKRTGDRRDQGGSGARTYFAQCKALGLIFIQQSTGMLRLTLAGEALLKDESPVPILTHQLMKFQYPSSYSLGPKVDVNPDFKIRPFRFLLRLLCDERIRELTQEEIAKIVVTEASLETNSCYEYIVGRILEFRLKGDDCLPTNYVEKHNLNPKNPFDNLNNTANTFINYLSYTQFIEKVDGRAEGKKARIRIAEHKRDEVELILSKPLAWIDRPENEEVFQRKYGIDPAHDKDTRPLDKASNITQKIINENLIKQAYLNLASQRPIVKITDEIVDIVAEQAGLDRTTVKKGLQKQYPHGSIGVFMAEYYEMAFDGRKQATKFEKATVALFRDVFGFKATHVGPLGRTPDILVTSDAEGYQAIIDNKAYSQYSISNDHHNRMVQNYIGAFQNYSDSDAPLAFFSYVAGGFGRNFDNQVKAISAATGINGSGISVSTMIKLVECYTTKGYTHKTIRDLLSLNRQVLSSDF